MRHRPATRFQRPTAPCLSLLLLLMLTLLSACAGTPDNATPRADARQLDSNVVHADVCRAGDNMISGPESCLQDDAACYQIETGNWCTGVRGNVCPAGSSPLPAGAACPPGRRCIRLGESLECLIGG